MQVIQTVCDECGAKKTESSRWFKIKTSRMTGEFVAVHADSGVKGEWVDACGSECLHKMLNVWLSMPEVLIDDSAR